MSEEELLDVDPMIERQILRKLVKRAIIAEGVSLVDPNRMRRRLGSLAHSLGENIDDVQAVVSPIILEIATEMVTVRKKKVRRPRK
jgi:hypothetical protein